jgi:serine/threonine protein kinase/DNA-binding response OmpR family regulator
MRKSYKVLIADPDDNYLEFLGNYLTKNGYSIIKVKKGKQAFQFALKVDPDICVLDSQLEDVNGFAVCRSIRKRRPTLPVLVCSSLYKGEENLKKAKEKFLATGLIEKPCPEVIILERIKTALAEKTPMPAVHKTAPSLEDKLEQTLSGLDLTGLTPRKKKKAPSSSATIQIDTEELKKELGKLRADRPISQSYREKPQFKVTSSEAGASPKSRLSSRDIFGDLISDIEKGAKKKSVAKERVIEVKTPPPAPSAQQPPKPSSPPVSRKAAQTVPPVSEPDVFSFDDSEIDALPGFGVDDKPSGPSPDSKANDYELIEKIAAGGMAEVWKARLKGKKGFEKIVAIKKILPHLSDNEEFITMFIDEAKVAANLTHPNIAQIYELGNFGDTFFIAMEYVSGKNLRMILNQCNAMKVLLPPSIVAFIGVKLCNALDYAHKKKDHSKNQPLNIVHRDISPQNILVSGAGEIKLVDFGIAKATIKAANTVAGSLKGKLLYMSPEQAEGKAIDHRSDIFSVGNLLYECLTGKRLVDGDSELSILKKVREANFLPPRKVNPKIPERLERILLKALQKLPENRYNTARDLEKELKNFMKAEKMHITESDAAEFLKFVDKKDNRKISEFDQTKSSTGREEVILPDISEVRKFERDSLLGLGKKQGSIPKWIWVALTAIIMTALIYILYFFVLADMFSKDKPKSPVLPSEKVEESSPAKTEESLSADNPTDLPDETNVENGAFVEKPITVNTPEDVVSSDGNKQDDAIPEENTEPSLDKEPSASTEETGPATKSPADTQSLTTDKTPSDKVETPVKSTTEPPPATSEKDAAKNSTASQTEEESIDAMLEQMKKLQEERARKRRKLQAFRKKNELPVQDKNKKDPKKGEKNG